MSEHSAISWTDATWNCLAGCTRVSAGCDLCYAAELAAKRLKNTPTYRGLATVTRGGRAAFNGLVRYIPGKLAEPLRWQQGRKIFVNSMSDLFHDAVPEIVIDRVFTVMALAPRHTFQILTKRPARMKGYLDGLTRDRLIECARYDAEGRPPIAGGGARSLLHVSRRGGYDFPELPLPNVWTGVSAEDQPTWDERVEQLGRVRAAVRFVSAEPLLGDIECGNAFDPPVSDSDYQPVDWVIIGGESGRGHRPMDVAWAESLAAQCDRAGVPVFTKQDSGPKPGKQGRLSDAMWALKKFPGVPEGAHA